MAASYLDEKNSLSNQVKTSVVPKNNNSDADSYQEKHVEVIQKTTTVINNGVTETIQMFKKVRQVSGKIRDRLLAIKMMENENSDDEINSNNCVVEEIETEDENESLSTKNLENLRAAAHNSSNSPFEKADQTNLNDQTNAAAAAQFIPLATPLQPNPYGLPPTPGYCIYPNHASAAAAALQLAYQQQLQQQQFNYQQQLQSSFQNQNLSHQAQIYQQAAAIPQIPTMPSHHGNQNNVALELSQTPSNKHSYKSAFTVPSNSATTSASASKSPNLSSNSLTYTPRVNGIYQLQDNSLVQSINDSSYLVHKPLAFNASSGNPLYSNNPQFYNQGLFCSELIECSNSSPCQNGARCVSSHGKSQCVCVNGYTGPDCSINIDDCASNPCSAGSICHDRIGSFFCECSKGWTGLLCQLRDGCASNPCHPSATCYANPTNGSAMCSCPKGYKGDDCSIDINECEESGSPCEHGGTCVNTEGSFRCDCLPGFTGSRCEININECASNPCINEGTCLDEIGGFRCICAPGYTGTQCETDIDECVEKPCLNNGPGFTGPNCQTDINECLSNPCYHGGVCHDLANGFKCECPLGFTGLNCEIDIDECASSPCANGGKCHDLPNGFKCTCPKGYYDARCMSDVNECDPNPCLNGAQCEDDVNKYICHCLPGYTGPRCELEVDACASSPCQHNGQCMNYMGNYKCVCPAGFTGKSCEINISDCNASLFGDCLLGYNVNPWVNCTHSTFCWKAFSDGVCNEVCNTKECLFDGMDCLNKQKNAGSNNRYIIDKDDKQNQDIRLNGKRRQCNPEFDSYCQRNYQNGYCDQGCNNEQCGWDGLDCLEVNQKNNVKQYNYAELPYVAKGSLLITLDVPFNKLTETNEIQNSQKTKADERPIHFILRVLSQIVGTTLRVKQDFNDGNLVLRPVKNDNGENLTEVEVIADNRMCEYDCFDSAMQIANYLAAFQARTNELSHQFGHNTKFSLKSIRAREEAESLVGQNYPKEKEATSIVSWISCCIVIIFIGVLLGVLITNNKKRVAHGITWFPEGFTLKSGASCRSISTYNAAGGEYSRNKPLSKLRGNLHKLDRKPDGQEMSKNWMGSENLKTIPENKDLNTISHVIYEEPKDPRPWSMQHYEAYGDGKNQSSNNNGSGIVMPLQMYPDLKQILHPGLMQPQNMVMQTKANTEPPTNGLLSPPLVGCPGGVDVTGPSGLTPLMVAAAFRGATPFCGVGGDETSTTTPVTETTQLLDNELMDTHNGPGSASSSNGTSGNSSSSMIDALISQGASVDKKMENTGETSLHLAARFCRADAVKRLLEAKADCNAQDFSGRTPLHTAIAADACGAFEILIRNRATQLNAKSNDGNTPLIIAVRNCADSMMNELLLAGADVNASDNAERSALHWAAMVSNLKALKALIEYGANKDAQDEKEQTPLFLAAREGAYECVKTLLQAGANKDITDHMDVSPRKIAETKGHKDILGLLDGNVPITITNNSNNQNLNTQNSSANNPTSPHIVSPKKSSNSTTAIGLLLHHQLLLVIG
ncbi:hypothetical protein RND71_043368 [Anisodus tanguticus]|uniref:Notch n=1 Tax=Anisodus tanguticus TaxID=243964 RepID=A0AAE1UTT7_9SOLA|nr:hypothetical protein RND71_043368 [Anisodus tanguticus]